MYPKKQRPLEEINDWESNILRDMTAQGLLVDQTLFSYWNKYFEADEIKYLNLSTQIYFTFYIL